MYYYYDTTSIYSKKLVLLKYAILKYVIINNNKWEFCRTLLIVHHNILRHIDSFDKITNTILSHMSFDKKMPF